MRQQSDNACWKKSLGHLYTCCVSFQIYYLCLLQVLIWVRVESFIETFSRIYVFTKTLPDMIIFQIRRPKKALTTLGCIIKCKYFPKCRCSNLLENYLYKYTAFVNFKDSIGKIKKYNCNRTPTPFTSGNCIAKIDLACILTKYSLGTLKLISVCTILTFEDGIITSSIE